MLESALELSTGDKSDLSTKLSTLREEFDGVMADHNSTQQLLSVCQTQLEDVRKQLVKKDTEKEVGVVKKQSIYHQVCVYIAECDSWLEQETRNWTRNGMIGVYMYVTISLCCFRYGIFFCSFKGFV